MIMNTLIVNIHAHTNICVLQRSLSQCKQETNERGQPQERLQQESYESDQSQDRDEERQHGRNQLLQDSDEERQPQESVGNGHVALTIPDSVEEEQEMIGHSPEEVVVKCQQESSQAAPTDDEPNSVSQTFFLLLRRMCQSFLLCLQFQGQYVHGSLSSMVHLPNDAQHVYSSEVC